MKAWLNGLVAEFFLRMSLRTEAKAQRVEAKADCIRERARAFHDLQLYFDGVESWTGLRRRASQRNHRAALRLKAAGR